MNYKPNSKEMDRLMHQVRRIKTPPMTLMREALDKYLNELEAQELEADGKQFSN